ncbi:MAG TPA: hypothetical protein VFY32_06235 [Solirubrobacteraceae bacterium]|nr:hypothetical protein [Solirubrobacteraceae bacterium]
MPRTRRAAPAVLAAFALALAVPAIAAAATKPGVTTLGASKVTITTATLTGQVNPHGAPTTYYFQYGTNTAYGSRTPSADVGGGTAAVGATAPIAGLGPHTKYHYRLVAHNSLGTTPGGDRTFTTPKQPLGLALAATPNPVPFGAPSTLAGTLSGTGNAGRPIQLQQKPFPFTTAFANVGNPQLTNAQGGFSFALLSVPLTTQYRVLLTGQTSVVSPILTVNVTVVVGTKTTRTHVHRGGSVHFSGTVHPNVPNIPIAIQKLNAKNHWVTISGTITRNGGVYGKTVRIRRGGSYRVYAGASGGTFAPGVGRKVRIHTA